MPIPRIGVAGGPIDKPDYSAIENFIPNLLEAKHAPQKLKEEREQAKRTKLKEELAQRFMEEYGPRRNEAEIGFLEGHAAKELFNASPEMNAADLALKQAHAKYYGNNLTTSQREAAQAYPNDPEAQQRALRREFGDFGEGNAPPADVPVSVIGRSSRDMNKDEWNSISKEMRAQEPIARGMVEGTEDLKKMKQLIKDNPNLWKSFAYIYENTRPDNQGAISSYIGTAAVNEKDKTALDKFRKLSSGLVLSAGQAMGGAKNFTDARQQLTQESKPSLGATDEALQYNIDQWLDRFSIGKPYLNALQWGLKDGRQIVRDDDAFKTQSLKNQGKYENPTHPEKGTPDVSEYSNYGPNYGGNDTVTVENPITGKTETMTRAEAIRRGAQ